MVVALWEVGLYDDWSSNLSDMYSYMGSPISVVVAEIVMQSIKEQALAAYKQTVPLWLRYVDDTFTAVHKDEIDTFHEHLNRQNADIQFTREVEEKGKIPFLDCLVSRHDNKLQTTIYRKPTHTDRLLDHHQGWGKVSALTVKRFKL